MKIDHTLRPALPLCANYLGVIVDAVVARVQGGDGPASTAVRWGLAVLPDGECEAIEFEPSSGPDPTASLFAQLRARGVQALRVVMGPGDLISRSAALSVYPRLAVLQSFEALRREGLRTVAPVHRQAVGQFLDGWMTALTLDLALDAVDVFSVSRLGRTYPGVVARWRVALLDSAPLFALGARQRRMLCRGDRLVRDTHDRLQRTCSPIPSSAPEWSRFCLVLSRIGPTLLPEGATLSPRGVAYGRRPGPGRHAACA
jgi:transposase-like protein